MGYKDTAKQKEFQHNHYLENKESFVEKNKQRRTANKVLVETYKRKRCCNQCGESDSACLDLHHKVPGEKDDGIAQGIRDWGSKRIQRELLKCEVLCSNCHRKHHSQDKVRTTNNLKRIRNREFVDQYKKSHPCKCGESCSYCLDFHHIDAITKEINISKATTELGFQKLIQEIEKCEVVCSNCHRKLHGNKYE